MRVVRNKALNMIALGRCLRLVATLVLALLCISAVLQSGIASAQNANPTRDLPDAPVQRGETFDVIVTFTAPSDDFNAIGIIDNIPTGWDIQVDKTWCTPNADQANTVDNQAGNQSQFMWYGPYSSGESFTALYKVTVPAYAEFDTYLFNGQLGYKIASSARIFKDIGGDSNTDVIAADPSTTPTPTPAPSPSPTLTPTPASSLTPTPSSTPSPTLTPTPAASLTPTPTSTPSPAPSPTLTPTPAPSLTPTPIPATGGDFGTGAWTGIGIGVLVGIMLVVGLVVWIAKRRRIKEA